MFKTHYNEKNVKLLEMDIVAKKFGTNICLNVCFVFICYGLHIISLTRMTHVYLNTLCLHLSITVSNACHNTHIHSSINFYVTILFI